MSTHILATFEQALANLRNEVLTMGSLATRSLTSAGEALFRRDKAAGNACVADDEGVDELEKQIDRLGVELMLRFQPVASDMRNVIAAMKISANLERVGDLSVGIARRAIKMAEYPELSETLVLEPVYLSAANLFRDALRAFADKDVDLSRSLKARDRDIDERCKQYDRLLADAIVKNPESVRGYMNLIVICRNIERIADHAKNIGEDAVYAFVAEDIRHT